MLDQEHTPAPLLITRGPTTGEIYLQGYADGYHQRPPVIQRTKKAQAAYSKGYNAGSQTRRSSTARP